MKTAAAYIRVSTEEQTELSPDSQIKLIRDYAKKNDMILPDEYIFHDDGISGRTTAKRPGFKMMIGTAKSTPTPFEVILVWKFSRFARNREDSIVYKSMLRKSGIDVVSISEPIGDDKMSVLIEALIEAMDEYYSINLSEEVRRGMTEKFNRGLKISAPPLGYKMQDGEFAVDEDTRPIIEHIFDLYVNGSLGCRAIARKLNDENYTTKGGKMFEARTVQYILGNPVYIGKQRWTPGGGGSRGHYRTKDADNVVEVDAKHKPIIDVETFEKAQIKILQSRSKNKYTRDSATKHEYMLRGLVFCSSCGGGLTMCQGGKSIQCYQYAHGRCKISHNISISKINALVIADIESLVNGSQSKIDIVNMSTASNSIKLEKIDLLIKKSELKLSRIKSAYMDGIDTLDEYKSAKIKVTAEINQLTDERTALDESELNISDDIMKSKIIVSASRVLDIIKSEKTSDFDKNVAIKEIIDRIIFDRKKSEVHIFYKYTS